MNELKYAQVFFETENVTPINQEIINELPDRLKFLYQLWIIEDKSGKECALNLSISYANLYNIRLQLHDALARNKIMAEKYKSIHGYYPSLKHKNTMNRKVCDLDFVFEPYITNTLVRFANITL